MNRNIPNVTSKSSKNIPVQEEEIEPLDDAIVNGLKGIQKDFCLRIEKILRQFAADARKQEEVIGDLDKFQRKIVHKMCDLFYINRNVDMKPDDRGDMFLIKNPESKAPKLTLMETMKYFEEKSKVQQPKKTFAVKQKVLTKPTEPQIESIVKPMSKIILKTRIESTAGGNQVQSNNIIDQGEEIEVTQEEAEALMRKHEEYEKAKSKYFGGTDSTSSKENAGQAPEETGKKKDSKKKAITSNNYDPAYDRNLTAQKIAETNVYVGPNPYMGSNPMYGQMQGMLFPQPQMNMGGYMPQGYGMPNPLMMGQNYYPMNYNQNFNGMGDMNFPTLGGGDANFPPLKSDMNKGYGNSQNSYPRKKDF